jgi:hypothetical protein
MSSALSYFMNTLRLLSHSPDGHDLLDESKIFLLYFVPELKFFTEEYDVGLIEIKIRLIKY